MLGHVVLAEGSPFVSFTAAQDVTLSSTVTGGSFAPGDDGAATADAGHLAVGARRRARPTAARRRSSAGRVGHLVRAAPGRVRRGAATALATAAADPVTGVDVTYGVDDDVARTTLTYRTAGGSPTAYVTMPHHRAGDQPERDGLRARRVPERLRRPGAVRRVAR